MKLMMITSSAHFYLRPVIIPSPRAALMLKL